MTTNIKAPVVIETSHDYVWTADFDSYDGAPDAGHQCVGQGSVYPGKANTELAAVLDLYDDWEGWYGEEGDPIPNPLCAHRPMFVENILTGPEWAIYIPHVFPYDHNFTIGKKGWYV